MFLNCFYFTANKLTGRSCDKYLNSYLKTAKSDFRIYFIVRFKMNTTIFVTFAIASVAIAACNAGVIGYEDYHPDQSPSHAPSQSDLLADSFGSLVYSAGETEGASKFTRQKRQELNLHYKIGGGGFGTGGGYRGENRKQTKILHVRICKQFNSKYKIS